MAGEPLKLIFLTPEGESETVPCGSVNVFACDNASGEGGGSVGILKGHIAAVIALEIGSKVTAKSGGEVVFSKEVPGGFAMVKNDVVTVLTDDAIKE